MLKADQLTLFKKAFPQFNNDPKLLNLIQAHCHLVTMPADTVLCYDGQTSTDLPLLISGLVRVYKISETGREITLYHIGDQESCVLSASTILGAKKFPAIAQTVTESTLVILPEGFVREWVVQSTEWQQFIFGLVAQRLTDVITVVEEVAFQRMDKRVAKHLLSKHKHNGLMLSVTHQEIADEVGTAREVITRVLHDLELRGIVNISRGKIEIVGLDKLEQLLV